MCCDRCPRSVCRECLATNVSVTSAASSVVRDTPIGLVSLLADSNYLHGRSPPRVKVVLRARVRPRRWASPQLTCTSFERAYIRTLPSPNSEQMSKNARERIVGSPRRGCFASRTRPARRSLETLSSVPCRKQFVFFSSVCLSRSSSSRRHSLSSVIPECAATAGPIPPGNPAAVSAANFVPVWRI